LFILGEIAVVVGAYCDPAVRGSAHLAAAWVGVGAVFYLLFFRKGGRGSESRGAGDAAARST